MSPRAKRTYNLAEATVRRVRELSVGEAYRSSGVRSELLKGLSEPIEVVTLDWR